MAAGGIRSLISGKSDFELVTEGSQFSYFLQEFKARPKFQCQMLPFPFEGTCHYGDMYTQTLPTAGDLLTRIYLKVTLPNILPSVYATSIGNYLFEYAELMINRQVIERYYGEFNQLVQEITVPQIKQPLLSKLSGKDVPNLTGPNTFYIEIPFSLCERGIPMLAVAPGSFEIRIKYRASTEFTFPPVQITDFVNGEFLMEYVYLGPDEAKYFEDKKRTYLVQQTQLYQGIINPGQTTVSYPLHFIGPVKELFFYIEKQTVSQNVFDGKLTYNPVNVGDYIGDIYIPLYRQTGPGGAIAYGDGYFVSVSFDGIAIWSNDHGQTWTTGSIQPHTWKSVTYGGGYFVAVSWDGYSAYSADHGQTWIITDTLSVNTDKLVSVSYGDGYFVTTTQSNVFRNPIFSDDHGQTWHRGTVVFGETYADIAYGGGYFVAVGYNDYNKYASYSSNHGITWTSGSIQNHLWKSIAYGGGYFVAVSEDGYCSYSSDHGQNWTPGSIQNHQWESIAYGSGYFVAVADGYCSYSSDHGQTWTPSSSSHRWVKISYGSGYFVAVSISGEITYSSTNGNTWIIGNVPTSVDQLINLQLMLDGYEVISQDVATPLYLRGVQPMDFHTRIPTSTIFYIYSFCLDPENMEPTGHLNFGRIQQQILNMNVVQSTNPRYVRVYARSYNIFTTEKGIGKLLFNSNG